MTVPIARIDPAGQQRVLGDFDRGRRFQFGSPDRRTLPLVPSNAARRIATSNKRAIVATANRNTAGGKFVNNRFSNPKTMPAPRGYTQVVETTGRAAPSICPASSA